MTLEAHRDINGHNVDCDGKGCNRNLEIEDSQDDFQLVQKTLREEKWVTRKEADGVWRHFCPVCKNRASNERGSAGVVV